MHTNACQHETRKPERTTLGINWSDNVISSAFSAIRSSPGRALPQGLLRAALPLTAGVGGPSRDRRVGTTPWREDRMRLHPAHEKQ
jgi:hypothetical protein